MKRITGSSAILIILLSGFLMQIQCKYLTKSVQMSKFSRSPHSVFLFKSSGKRTTRGKFQYRPSMISNNGEEFDLKLGIYNVHGFRDIYNDDSLTCQEKLDRTITIHPLRIDLNSHLNAEVEINYLHYGIHGDRTELIHFVLFDCDENVKTKTSNDWKLTFTFDILQEGNTYLDLGETKVYWFKIVVLLIIFGFFAKYFTSIKREFLNEYSDTNYAFLLTGTGLVFKLISVLTDIIELHVLKSTGEESPVIHFFAKAFELGASYLILLVMLFIAHGWTITFSKIDDMELFLPLSIALGILKLILVGMGRLVKLEQHHFHAFDGFVGLIICVFNVTMLAYYFYQVRQLGDVIQKQRKVRKFYTLLSLIVIIYMLTFPTAYLLSYLMDDWKRAAVIEIVNTGGQLIGSLALSWLLTAKGRYSDIADFDIGLPSTHKRQD
jgi:Rhodopsin-like GPCR transmembrane domain